MRYNILLGLRDIVLPPSPSPPPHHPERALRGAYIPLCLGELGWMDAWHMVKMWACFE